jgi:curved DNA-binding protein CbpA/CheY-like chemotaxis protein
LTDNFFDVSTFKTQAEFIKKLSLKKPDLILFDYMLKHNESDEEITNFYVELKTSFVDIPVMLMYSTDTRDNVKKLFDEAHPDAMLKKPFKLMELLDKTNKVLYSGSLDKYPFPTLIQTFHDEKRTGVLHITVEGTKYFVYFIDGQIVYTEYGLRKDTLGILLLRQKKITEEQYNEALNDASKSRSRLGVSLIRLGILTPTELSDALEHQVNEKITNCFAEKEGTFSFKFQDRFIDDIVIYKKDTRKIIFEGVKSHYGTERLSEFIKMIKKKKFKVNKSVLNELDAFLFDTVERKIISKLKALCRYDELSLKPEIDTLLLTQILYTLFITGHLTVTDKNKKIKEVKAEKEIKAKDIGAGEPEIVKEATEIRSMIYGTYIKIKSLNYYEILDVPRDADPAMIKSAYTALAKKFHPDKFSDEAQPDVIQKATEIFAKLSNSFKTLTDETAKKEYDYKLDHPKEAEILSNANEIIESEMEFVKGEKFLKQRAFKKAEHSFDVATKMNPKEPDYKCYYGWAHFLNPENDKKKKVTLAKRLIREALGVNSKNDMAHYFLGAIAKFEGNLRQAKTHFKKALTLNPKNSEASVMMKVIRSKGKK